MTEVLVAPGLDKIHCFTVQLIPFENLYKHLQVQHQMAENATWDLAF